MNTSTNKKSRPTKVDCTHEIAAEIGVLPCAITATREGDVVVVKQGIPLFPHEHKLMTERLFESRFKQVKRNQWRRKGSCNDQFNFIADKEAARLTEAGLREIKPKAGSASFGPFVVSFFQHGYGHCEDIVKEEYVRKYWPDVAAKYDDCMADVYY